MKLMKLIEVKGLHVSAGGWIVLQIFVIPAKNTKKRSKAGANAAAAGGLPK